MAKILKTLRYNWKKSVFFASAFSYGTYYLIERKYQAELLQAYCYEALKYSREKVLPDKVIKRVTIFLNPIANKERGKYLFDKNVAPILNLSGLDVRLIRLDKNSEANEYMREIDLNDTDVIVVAGGNATLNEVISGLVNRSDSVEFLKRIPIGLIPIGETNTFAHKWLGKHGIQRTDETEFRLLADSAMAIIKGETVPADLIKVTLSHSPNIGAEENYEDKQGTDSKKRGAYSLLKENQIYALSKFSCGFVTAVDANVDSYWYLGWLKSHMNKYFSKRFLQRQPIRYKFCYKLKCFGCSKCLNKEELNKELEILLKDPNANKPKSSVLSLLGTFKTIGGIKSKENVEEKTRRELKQKQLYEKFQKSNITNPNCDKELTINLTQVQIVANINNWEFDDENMPVSIIADEPTYIDTVIVKDPDFNPKEMHLANKKLLTEFIVRKYNNESVFLNERFNANRFAIEIDGEIYKLNNKSENDLIVKIKHIEKCFNLIKSDPSTASKIEVNYWPNIYMLSKQAFMKFQGKNQDEIKNNDGIEMPTILPFERWYLKYWMPRNESS